jgi:coenzyme F420-reducing hydrogenase alpha subunit
MMEITPKRQMELDISNKILKELSLTGNIYECHTCHKMLPSVDFYHSKTRKGGVTSTCKNCIKIKKMAREAKEIPQKITSKMQC